MGKNSIFATPLINFHIRFPVTLIVSIWKLFTTLSAATHRKGNLALGTQIYLMVRRRFDTYITVQFSWRGGKSVQYHSDSIMFHSWKATMNSWTFLKAPPWYQRAKQGPEGQSYKYNFWKSKMLILMASQIFLHRFLHRHTIAIRSGLGCDCSFCHTRPPATGYFKSMSWWTDISAKKPLGNKMMLFFS